MLNMQLDVLFITVVAGFHIGIDLARVVRVIVSPGPFVIRESGRTGDDIVQQRCVTNRAARHHSKLAQHALRAGVDA